jgi:hypothetical protein
MSLSASVEVLVQQLDHFRRFPKYALERRLDVFLSLFVEEFLSTRFEAPVRMVAPEFPLKREGNQLSTNVDYLLRREGPTPAWLFLELKTSSDAVSREQLASYGAAREYGMRHVRRDLFSIRDAVGNDAPRKTRYNRLLEQLARAGAWLGEHPIEVVYLSPPSPLFDEPGNDWVRWIPLDEFARWKPRQHSELWEPVSELLVKLSVH